MSASFLRLLDSRGLPKTHFSTRIVPYEKVIITELYQNDKYLKNFISLMMRSSTANALTDLQARDILFTYYFLYGEIYSPYFIQQVTNIENTLVAENFRALVETKFTSYTNLNRRVIGGSKTRKHKKTKRRNVRAKKRTHMRKFNGSRRKQL